MNIIPSDELSQAEKVEWVRDMVISALLSDKIYHFGELLMSGHLDCLKNTSTEWHIHLILAFNSGNMDHFEGLIAQHASDVNSLIKFRFLNFIPF